MSFYGRLVDRVAIYHGIASRRPDGQVVADYGTSPATGLDAVPCRLEIMSSARILSNFGFRLDSGALLLLMPGVDLRSQAHSASGFADKLVVTQSPLRNSRQSTWFVYSAVNSAEKDRILRVLLKGSK